MTLSHRPALRTAAAFLALAAAFTSGCGGGSDDEAGTPLTGATPAATDNTAPRQKALAAAATITPAQLFLWAQATYPDLFPDSPPNDTVVHEGRSYEVRGYSSGNFLGVSNGQAYGLGPFTNGQLVDFGAVDGFVATVCERVNCGPSPYALGSVYTAVTAGAPTSTSLRRRLNRQQSTSFSLNGSLSGNVTALAGQAIYLIIEDPLGVFSPNGSLTVAQRGAGFGYELTLNTVAIPRAGRYTSSVNLYACFDAQCNTRLGGTPTTIQYDLTVL